MTMDRSPEAFLQKKERAIACIYFSALDRDSKDVARALIGGCTYHEFVLTGELRGNMSDADVAFVVNKERATMSIPPGRRCNIEALPPDEKALVDGAIRYWAPILASETRTSIAHARAGLKQLIEGGCLRAVGPGEVAHVHALQFTMPPSEGARSKKRRGPP